MWKNSRPRLPRNPGNPRFAFTLMEVLVAMAVLSIALVALHQAYSSTLFVNSVTNGLWKAILYTHNELQAIERRRPVPAVSLTQGEYATDHPLAGYTWRREVTDEEPFPGVTVRKVALEVSWRLGASPQLYTAEIYVEAK